MVYSCEIVCLAQEFMRAAGFYGGGQKDSLGSMIMQDLNDAEEEEYNLDLQRTDVSWAEFFSKAAIRQGRLSDVAALVPANMIDKNTVKDLAQSNPQFALVVSVAQQPVEQTSQATPPAPEYYGRMSCMQKR